MDNPDKDDDLFNEWFKTKAEATAFSDGLTWGDEPQFEVVELFWDAQAQEYLVQFKYKD